MSSEKDNILEFNQYIKSDKMPYMIYADIVSLITKIDGCVNNPENSSATKIGDHIPCEYSMSTIWAFDQTESKDNLYHKKGCTKIFCKSLRERAKKIINIEKENATIDRRRTKIISRYKSMLYLRKKNLEKAL